MTVADPHDDAPGDTLMGALSHRHKPCIREITWQPALLQFQSLHHRSGFPLGFAQMAR